MGWKITQSSALADGIHLLKGWKITNLALADGIHLLNEWKVTNLALADGMEDHSPLHLLMRTTC